MADRIPPPDSALAPLDEEFFEGPSNASLPASPPAPRRRRIFGRLTRLDDETRTGSGRSLVALNPQANEFIPFGRTPSKRKASSSARPAKNVPSTSRRPGSDRGTSENPIVHAQDMFGAGALLWSNVLGDVREAPELTDDEDESGLFDMDMPDISTMAAATAGSTDNVQRERLNDAMMVVRAQLAEKTKRVLEPVYSHSAILFSRGDQKAANETEDFVNLRYLPLCPSSGRREPITKDTDLMILPSHRNRINAAIRGLSQCRAIWPKDQIPVELFDLITAFLSRDDVRSMRLVSREFEEKVSANLFASSVVPFNTELYDMIEVDSKAAQRMPRSTSNSKGKHKATTIDVPGQGTDAALRGLHWQNAKDDADGKVYKGHGLRVFQGFGPYFRRFGMSFEVTEAQLARPPIKKELDHFTAYHGSYDWPHDQYTRFAGLAGLERTADETLRMKAAFSNIQRVQEIGLSLDNGLGWLNGPDRSVYARVFQRDSPVFGPARPVPDQKMQDAKVFWQAVQDCHASIGVQGNQREFSMGRRMLMKAPNGITGLQNTNYANTKLWSSITAGKTAPTIAPDSCLEDGQHGVLYTTFSQPDSTTPAFDKKGLVPNELRREQKEWLMETDWAQRAFLECYLLAVVDNPRVFGGVKKLTIAKISSGLLPILSREAFWNALPAVSDVTIHVKPDWRTVERDNAGNAETCQRHPSEAVNVFYACILRDLCHRPSVTTLNVGWQAGGEHSEGIFTRNNHVLPAPITQLEHSTALNDQSGLVFRYVEHLTLHNCWLTPVALQGLVRRHANMALKTLVLDSVSLTAHPRFPAGGQAAMQNQVFQALAALPAAAGQGVPPNLPQWLQNVQGLPAGLQQMLQNNAQQAAQMGWPQLAQQAPNQFLHVAQAPPSALQFAPANIAAHAQQQAGIPAPPAPAPFVLPPPVALGQPGLPAHMAQNHFVAPPNPSMQQNPPVPSNWTEGHREGSWADVLDKLSPGSIFSDFLPPPAPWEEQLPEREVSNLRAIVLKSCGYVKITNNTTFDQFAIELGADHHHLSAWFRARQTALHGAMMSTNDRYMGRIVQHMQDRELDALRYAWGLHEGWSDRAKAEEAEYDGLLLGGTGRFSGEIVSGTSTSQMQA
ncbi:hypothetical protein Slin15195_G032040 [Septoria linicola]|uniref:F-box domain-containing protein n=1 Tax=Septoria linicola TaxID=215465 RepID=A0A9Q9ANY1_9PEZI|nr:hypothetical protein Slin14017_G031060 [Septoria linicola]USW49885.1 hypothetical protein Slin15195_G032040 [Septoria linicola]